MGIVHHVIIQSKFDDHWSEVATFDLGKLCELSDALASHALPGWPNDIDQEERAWYAEKGVDENFHHSAAFTFDRICATVNGEYFSDILSSAQAAVRTMNMTRSTRVLFYTT